ncbi:MAG: hypothetical protein HY543_07070 [Deltaproteobacteria bacterium]|nr:hypothetical protein [Deltaproteobacteria bacterium]
MLRSVCKAVILIIVAIGLFGLFGVPVSPLPAASDDDAEDDGPSFYAGTAFPSAVSVQLTLLTNERPR